MTHRTAARVQLQLFVEGSVDGIAASTDMPSTPAWHARTPHCARLCPFLVCAGLVLNRTVDAESSSDSRGAAEGDSRKLPAAAAQEPAPPPAARARSMRCWPACAFHVPSQTLRKTTSRGMRETCMCSHDLAPKGCRAWRALLCTLCILARSRCPPRFRTKRDHVDSPDMSPLPAVCTDSASPAARQPP